jgi:hypothetical protein
MAAANNAKTAPPAKKKVPGRPFSKGDPRINRMGRPKVPAEFVEAMRDRTPAAVDALVRALKSPRTRVEAAKVILGYSFGKPIQGIELAGKAGGAPISMGFINQFLEGMTDEQVLALEQTLAAATAVDAGAGPGGALPP